MSAELGQVVGEVITAVTAPLTKIAEGIDLSSVALPELPTLHIDIASASFISDISMPNIGKGLGQINVGMEVPSQIVSPTVEVAQVVESEIVSPSSDVALQESVLEKAQNLQGEFPDVVFPTVEDIKTQQLENKTYTENTVTDQDEATVAENGEREEEKVDAPDEETQEDEEAKKLEEQKGQEDIDKENKEDVEKEEEEKDDENRRRELKKPAPIVDNAANRQRVYIIAEAAAQEQLVNQSPEVSGSAVAAQLVSKAQSSGAVSGIAKIFGDGEDNTIQLVAQQISGRRYGSLEEIVEEGAKAVENNTAVDFGFGQQVSQSDVDKVMRRKSTSVEQMSQGGN